MLNNDKKANNKKANNKKANDKKANNKKGNNKKGDKKKVNNKKVNKKNVNNKKVLVGLGGGRDGRGVREGCAGDSMHSAHYIALQRARYIVAFYNDVFRMPYI